MGVISPVGNTLEAFWSSMKEGRSGTGPLARFDSEKFSSKISAEVKDFDPSLTIDPKEIKRTDVFAQYALAAAAEAVAHSGLEIEAVDKKRAGVIIGSGIGGIQTIEKQKEMLDAKGPRRISPFLIPMLLINMGSGLVSIRYGFRGPNSTVVSACATGNSSIGDAFRHIQRGDVDVMLTGGTEAGLTPLGFGGFCSLRALSTRNDEPERASRPFDKNRDGFVMGEGAAVIVLEELEYAKKRGATIYAELAGYGVSADAYHITMPEPNGQGAQECIQLALDDGQLSTDDVDYVNAHGTSTPLNDKMETAALKTLFGEHAKNLAISSTKSMTGHLLAAAGAVECVACIKALSDGIIPPTINYETPDPECDLDYVPNEARERDVKVAISNAFGFGGHNAVLAMKKYE